MRIADIKAVKPAKDNVVVETIEPNRDNKLFFATNKTPDTRNTQLSFGKVLAIGPDALEAEHCPDLNIDDTVTYNIFAGSHIATNNTKELYKVMGGYSIMARIKDIDNLNEETIFPTSNRLLIAVKFVDQTQEGLFLSAEEAKDPRLEDLDYGVVIKVGPSCKLGYEVGDVVAYQPYAGENIRPPLSVEKPALRVLIEEDVLLTI